MSINSQGKGHLHIPPHETHEIALGNYAFKAFCQFTSDTEILLICTVC